MSVRCETLFEDAAKEFGVDTGNEVFIYRFVVAVNRSLDELSQRADLASPFAHIESTDDSIDIDPHYTWILAAGITFNLIRLGQRPSDPKIAAIVYQDSGVRWETAIGTYITQELNDDQADEDNDIIAFGSVV